jgi:hypothetical protein
VFIPSTKAPIWVSNAFLLVVVRVNGSWDRDAVPAGTKDSLRLSGTIELLSQRKSPVCARIFAAAMTRPAQSLRTD